MNIIVKILLTIGAAILATIIQVLLIVPFSTYALKGSSLNGIIQLGVWLIIFGVLAFLIWKKKK